MVGYQNYGKYNMLHTKIHVDITDYNLWITQPIADVTSYIQRYT